MKKESRYDKTRKALIFWALFIGVGAVAGAACMIADPSGKIMGMDAMLPYFKKLPFADLLFNDFLFSGIALLIVNGVTDIVAAGFLFAKKKVGVILSEVFGITLMLWICIQFYMFPFNFMSTAFFIFGFIQAVTGYAAYVFLRQEEFCVNASDYKNVGSDKSRLVVYFSRMGYVKKLVYEEAEKTGADVYEIKSTEKTAGTAGFWWCGRFAMHRWDMPIEESNIEFSGYENVTICSPIWVFALAAPVRTFCRKYHGKIKSVKYIFVHYTNGKYENAAKEADELLGLKNSRYTSVRCRKGKYKTIVSGCNG